MKKLLITLLSIASLPAFAACQNDTTSVVDRESAQESYKNDTTVTHMKIKIGSNTFDATLLNNATVTAFKARLPITVLMSELNGNEKLYNFSNDLPTQSANPGTINTGDLMLYGSNTLVVFYKTFLTSYRYTRLGRINNPAGLAAAVGSGNVTVTYELE